MKPMDARKEAISRLGGGPAVEIEIKVGDEEPEDMSNVKHEDSESPELTDGECPDCSLPWEDCCCDEEGEGDPKGKPEAVK